MEPEQIICGNCGSLLRRTIYNYPKNLWWDGELGMFCQTTSGHWVTHRPANPLTLAVFSLSERKPND